MFFQFHDRCPLELKPIQLNHRLRKLKRITIIQHNTHMRILYPQNLIPNPRTYKKRRDSSLFPLFSSLSIHPLLCPSKGSYKSPFDTREMKVSFQQEFLAFIRGVKAVGRGSSMGDVDV